MQVLRKDTTALSNKTNAVNWDSKVLVIHTLFKYVINAKVSVTNKVKWTTYSGGSGEVTKPPRPKARGLWLYSGCRHVVASTDKTTYECLSLLSQLITNTDGEYFKHQLLSLILERSSVDEEGVRSHSLKII